MRNRSTESKQGATTSEGGMFVLEAVMAYQSLIIVLVIAVLVIVILTTGYIKAPPDTAEENYHRQGQY